MSKKTLLILISILSTSSFLTPQSPPPYIRTYPSTIIVTKSKPPKPHQYLLDAIEDSSFSRFRKMMKKYYTNKAQLPEINIKQLSQKTVFDMYNTFPLIKAGIAKANKKQLKCLHRLQTKLFNTILLVKGLTSSALAAYLSYFTFKESCKYYNHLPDLALFSILYAAAFGLYYYGFKKICDGSINYKEYINKRIKENELISDYIESH